MKKLETYYRVVPWIMASLLGVLAAGCGGSGSGGNGQEPILGFGNDIATVAPAVTAVSPPSGALGVPLNTKLITAAFNKAMNPATISNSSFTLACPGNTPVAGAVTYNPVGNVATLTLPAATSLPASSVCTATVTTAVKDTFGIALAANFTWLFTTGPSLDSTAPTVTGTNIANGATGVAINTSVGATFSETMNAATVNTSSFTLKQGATAIAGTVSYFGVSAVFTPNSPLALNTTYTATIKGGAVGGVKDVAGNAMVRDYVWSWTTTGGLDPNAGRDTTPPTITGTVNANGASGVAVNTKVGASFSEFMDPLKMTNANFTLKNTTTGAAVAGTVSYSGVSVAFAPLANLAPNTRYTATIKGAPTGVSDLAGNMLLSDYNWSWTTGVAPDTTAPTVTDTINANGATNVAFNTKVGATFSEGMDPLSITNASFILTETSSGAVVEGGVGASGVSAIFIPQFNLLPSTNYTVTIKGGKDGVTDLAGNPMVTDFVIRWTTGAAPDTTAPTVTSATPANGATNVAFNSRVTAVFSEGLDPLTITNTTFRVTESVSGAVVAGGLGYSGVSAVFIPLENLTPSTRYTLTVKGLVNGVKDLAGNPMASDFVISWTTGAAPDTTAPTVTDTIQANGATNVAFNTKVGATFSEAMDVLTITNVNFSLKEAVSGVPVMGTISYSGVNALFVPLANLAPSTRYTVTVKGGASGVKDLAGNPMASDFVISWTTGAAPDISAPTVIDTIHPNGAINVPVNTFTGATFSEAMDPATMNNVNYTLTETVSGIVVPGTVGYAGVNVIFYPINGLAYSTNYTVRVKGGVTGVKDLAGNAMVNDFVIRWTTGEAPDTTPPIVTTVNPLDLATNVPVNTSVSATFSEAMDALTMNTANFQVAGVTGLVSFDAPSKTITFKPSNPLAENTTYTATISTGVKDIAGNTMVSNKVWRFTTVAPIVIPPVVTPINLGTASTYGTFGGTAGMTNMGTLTLINGNIGTTATGASSITGFHDTGGDIYTETGSNKGSVNGLIHTCTVSTTGPTSASVSAPKCALATQARLDAQTAYLFLAAKPPGANPGANLAGKTLAPGVYTAPSGSFLIQGGDLTLDAQGDPNAQFIFQMATTLTVGGPGAAFPQSIVLAGGAQAKNVFWQVGSFATINAGGGGTMVGTIISQAGVSFSTAGNVSIVTLNGRAMSLGASVTLVNTVINVP